MKNPNNGRPQDHKESNTKEEILVFSRFQEILKAFTLKHKFLLFRDENKLLIISAT